MYQKIRLQSRRNEVYRIADNDNVYILKNFLNAENIKKELELLKLLHSSGLYVPQIIKTEGLTLYIEDLGELTFLDWYENMEKTSKDYTDMLNKLIKWLKSFYSITYDNFNFSYILSDVNFRNFIIKDNEIYGIDFEQSEAGNIEKDAGKMAAYALTYTPMFTKWKVDFTYRFIDLLSNELKIDNESIITECNKELERIKIRRNIGKVSYI